MQAIVFINRQGNELAPLNQHYCPALLPVGNKALVEYTLEDLSTAGITEIKLVTSSQSQAIRQHLGNGEKWGISLSYFLSKPEESTSQVLKRLEMITDDFLVVRGDILRSPCIQSFIEFASKIPQQFIQANIAQHSAGLQLHHRNNKTNSLNDNDIDKLNWPLTVHSETQSRVTQVLHGACYLIDSFDSYLAANLAIAQGEILGLSPLGRKHESNHLLYLGSQTEIATSSQQIARGIIGQNSRISADSNLNGHIVIGNGCFIDTQSEIKNSLILDNSFVGKGLLLKDCIVSKNLLIKVSNQSCTIVTDPKLLADCSKQLSQHLFNVAENDDQKSNSTPLSQQLLAGLIQSYQWLLHQSDKLSSQLLIKTKAFKIHIATKNARAK